MQVGFYTAVLADQRIEDVARWAASAGFACLEVDMGSHADTSSRARPVIEAVRGEGIEVCALTVFGNPLDADQTERHRVRAAVTATIDAALENGVGTVVTFSGRDETASEDDNYRYIADYYAPLAAQAAQGHVNVAIENWPGPANSYVATTPHGWARLFELVPAPNLGLNFDPSHLIWQGIDPERALRAVAGRIFLTHAKDTEIFVDAVQQVGYFGSDWWTYRLPGHGLIDWRRWLRVLREVGFDGVVSVEHEDDDWGGIEGSTVARRQEGLREARRVLDDAMGEART